jgi:hypothetical protein
MVGTILAARQAFQYLSGNLLDPWLPGVFGVAWERLVRLGNSYRVTVKTV